MDCREAIASILEYLDGELTEADREAFARHLFACPACRDYFKAYKRTLALERDLAERLRREDAAERLPEDCIASLVRAIGGRRA